MRTRDSGVLALKVKSRRAVLVAKSELSPDRPMEKWTSSSFARPSSLASCVGQTILARRLRASQAVEAWRLRACLCERPSEVQAPHCFVRVLLWIHWGIVAISGHVIPVTVLNLQPFLLQC